MVGYIGGELWVWYAGYGDGRIARAVAERAGNEQACHEVSAAILAISKRQFRVAANWLIAVLVSTDG